MKKRLLIVTIIYILMIAQEVASFKHLHRQKRQGNSYSDYQSEQDNSQKQAEEEREQQQEEQQAEEQAQQEEEQAQQEQEQQNYGGRYKRSMIHNAAPIWVPSSNTQALNYQSVFNPSVPSSNTQSKTCIEYLRLIFSLLFADRVNRVADDITFVVISEETTK